MKSDDSSTSGVVPFRLSSAPAAPGVPVPAGAVVSAPVSSVVASVVASVSPGAVVSAPAVVSVA